MRQLMGVADVCAVIGRSRSTVNRYLQMPGLHFPKPVRLGPTSRAWYADEVERWVDALPSADPDGGVVHELGG